LNDVVDVKAILSEEVTLRTSVLIDELGVEILHRLPDGRKVHVDRPAEMRGQVLMQSGNGPGAKNKHFREVRHASAQNGTGTLDISQGKLSHEWPPFLPVE
jgi:hypothetical protein